MGNALALAMAAAGLGVAVVPAYALRLAGRSLSPAAQAIHRHLVAQFGALQAGHGAAAGVLKPPRRRRVP